MKLETELSLEEVAARVRELRIGHSFRVETDQERRSALVAARVLGKRLVTKASKAGGFTITALPE